MTVKTRMVRGRTPPVVAHEDEVRVPSSLRQTQKKLTKGNQPTKEINRKNDNNNNPEINNKQTKSQTINKTKTQSATVSPIRSSLLISKKENMKNSMNSLTHSDKPSIIETGTPLRRNHRTTSVVNQPMKADSTPLTPTSHNRTTNRISPKRAQILYHTETAEGTEMKRRRLIRKATPNTPISAGEVETLSDIASYRWIFINSECSVSFA